MKFEKRDIVLRRTKLTAVPIEDLTDGELQDIIAKMEADMDDISERTGFVGNLNLFPYLAFNYAMRLYQIEHLEKTKQKAEEKRLDETLKRLETFLKNS